MNFQLSNYKITIIELSVLIFQQNSQNPHICITSSAWEISLKGSHLMVPSFGGVT